MFVPDDGYKVNRISAVIVDKDQIVVIIYQLKTSDFFDEVLKMNDIHSNSNKYAPLFKKEDGHPLKYVTNVATHNNKLCVAIYCFGEEIIDLESDGGSFCWHLNNYFQ